MIYLYFFFNWTFQYFFLKCSIQRVGREFDWALAQPRAATDYAHTSYLCQQLCFLCITSCSRRAKGTPSAARHSMRVALAGSVSRRPKVYLKYLFNAFSKHDRYLTNHNRSNNLTLCHWQSDRLDHIYILFLLIYIERYLWGWSILYISH